MAVRVYVRMVVNKKDKRFDSFFIGKDWSKQPLSTTQVLARIDNLLPSHLESKGKLLLIEKNGDTTIWI